MDDPETIKGCAISSLIGTTIRMATMIKRMSSQKLSPFFGVFVVRSAEGDGSMDVIVVQKSP